MNRFLRLFGLGRCDTCDRRLWGFGSKVENSFFNIGTGRDETFNQYVCGHCDLVLKRMMEEENYVRNMISKGHLLKGDIGELYEQQRKV